MTTQTTHDHWIDPYEKAWMVISIVVLTGIMIAVTVAGFAFGIQAPSPQQRVDPNTVTQSGPFSKPGLTDLGGGQYEVYMVGTASGWIWEPKEIRVPVGSRVTFYLTSKDVQHGFMLWNTNLNMMVLPGQVSKGTVTFEKPGEYTYLCHEYCGIGHQTMSGKVIVQ
jgi:cytochrome c oxidase subunit 2